MSLFNDIYDEIMRRLKLKKPLQQSNIQQNNIPKQPSNEPKVYANVRIFNSKDSK